jgi:1-acyl-sn-glycerol-3-phosphate acyltransferase
VDWLIHFWAQASLRCTFSPLRLYGVDNLPPLDEAVMYVPNHTSFFDILALSGFIPRPMKYLSKAEILSIPIVGLSMKMARHVFLKRNDLRSTLEVRFKCDCAAIAQ